MFSLRQQKEKIKVQAKAELERRRRLLAKDFEADAKKRAEQERERRAYYQKHPVEWVADRLRIPIEHIEWSRLPGYAKHRWDGTKDPLKKMLESLARQRWVGIEGATGVSKTFFAACAKLWFLENFEDSVVVTTAPKKDQLELHLWKETSKLWPRFGLGKLMTLELRMRPDAPGDDGWKAVGFGVGVQAAEVGQSARRAQGFHAKDMLIIVEETPGVHQAVLTAFQNTCVAPNNLILALGNPDHQQDTLHKFCQLSRVEHITISAFDHPNVVLKDPDFIPGAQSEQGLKDMLDRYKDPLHPLYLSRARGISPKQAKDALIRYDWLMAAVKRRKSYLDPRGRLDLEKVEGMQGLGVDVANSEDGDKAAIARGKGPILIEVEDFPCPNANKLGEDVAHEMKVKGIAPEYVGVDGVGVGAGTVNELKRLGYDVVNLISSEAPVDLYDEKETDSGTKLAEDFDNLRSQMWWQIRRDLQDENSELCLPHDEELFADLMAPKWTVRNGKIVVLSKQEMVRKLGHSPNKGDAVVYWNWIRKLRSVPPALKGIRAKAGQAEEEKPYRSSRDISRSYQTKRRRSF